MSVAISRDEWQAALAEARKIDSDPDALTSSELAQLWGISTRSARERCQLLVARGLAVRVRKVIDRGTGSGGGLCPVPAYRLVKATKGKRG